MKTRYAEELQTVVDWVDAHAHQVLDDPHNDIIGLGVGRKAAGSLDDPASAWCATAFVERKQTPAELERHHLRDFRASAAAASRPVRGEPAVVLDVVETGSGFRAQSARRVPAAQRGRYGGRPPKLDLQRRFEQLRGGIGICNPVGLYPEYLTVGTLGFFVRDRDQRLFLVSNNHVIANENDARAGNAIVQPGTLDLTDDEFERYSTLDKLRRRMTIGKLAAAVPIRFHDDIGIPFNDVDCAMAEVLVDARDLSAIACVGLGGAITGVARPFRFDAAGRLLDSARVYKAGRTTGWTEGRITAINVVSDVEFSAGRWARFRNQIAIEASEDNAGPFSDSGDSGSAILNERHQLVGLLFAGSELQTFANPIRSVLSALQRAAALNNARGGSTLAVVVG